MPAPLAREFHTLFHSVLHVSCGKRQGTHVLVQLHEDRGETQQARARDQTRPRANAVRQGKGIERPQAATGTASGCHSNYARNGAGAQERTRTSTELPAST